MDGDPEITNAFEIADDGMQGILGYHLYVAAAVKSASFDGKFSKLPKGAIRITWNFYRRYSPTELIENMEEIFDLVQARTSLIVLVSTFEAAIRSFVALLNNKKRDDSIFKDMDPDCNYKPLLRTVFQFVHSKKESLFGEGTDEQTKKGRQRVPDLCLDIDDARRLRNLFMHNRGIFNDKYKTDALTIPSKTPGEYSRVLEFKENTPVLLSPESYVAYSCSHIELLHYLHDLLQRQYFGLAGGGYYYRGLGKVIEWRRLLIGI